jgi:hypothetical protein
MSKKAMTVEELSERLLELIDAGYGDKDVHISVNFGKCDHIQDLNDIWCSKHNDLDWILLMGRTLYD